MMISWWGGYGTAPSWAARLAHRLAGGAQARTTTVRWHASWAAVGILGIPLWFLKRVAARRTRWAA